MSIVHGKLKLLLVCAMTYFILGMSIFFYLFVNEMRSSDTDTDMKPLSDSKPKIYFTVFLKIIITFNVVGVVFRLLGSIFMLIYVRVSGKIKKGNYIFLIIIILVTLELNESLIPNLLNGQDRINHESINKNDSIASNNISKMNTSIHSIENNFNRSQYLIPVNKSHTFIETNSKRNSNNTIMTYMETEYNQNNNQNRINRDNVHYFKFNPMTENKNKNLTPNNQIIQFSNTYESEEEKNRDELLESFYETPKKVSFANCR